MNTEEIFIDSINFPTANIHFPLTYVNNGWFKNLTNNDSNGGSMSYN